MRRWAPFSVLGAAALVVVSGAMAYAAAYELFADLRGVHCPRVGFEPVFSARADAPTLSAAFTLAGAAAAIAAAVATVVATVKGWSSRAVVVGWAVQGVAFLVALASWLWGVIDFINNAGRFG